MDDGVEGVDLQPVIDAALAGRYDEAVSALLAIPVAAEGAPWFTVERGLIAAMLDLQRGKLGTSRHHRSRALAVADGGSLPRSSRSLVRTMEQAGVVACCAGDLEEGERRFARAGEEIDRAFRSVPVGAMLRNAYHRGLAAMLAGRAEAAAPHVDLARRLADRVLARYPTHPEAAAITALHAATTAQACRDLPFWFELGHVPVACRLATDR
jgi:hypothetical protein